MSPPVSDTIFCQVKSVPVRCRSAHSPTSIPRCVRWLARTRENISSFDNWRVLGERCLTPPNTAQTPPKTWSRMEPDPAPARRPRLGRVARSYKTEAVVLRSFRLGEADRVLHLYTLDRGRVGAVAKGVRKTKSRFGARLEPLSHAELLLHQGGGELQAVTGVELIRSHHAAREDPYRLNVRLVGLEAMLRLFTEQEANPRAVRALTRFLELLDEQAPVREQARAALDPLGLAFQLKLLWLSGYLQ